jgi:uncharacterized membrane protein
MIERLLTLETVYVMTGLVLLIFGAMAWRDASNPRRVTSGIFWLTLGIIFIFGGVLPHWVTGVLVLGMVLIDGLGGVGRGRPAEPTGGLSLPGLSIRGRIFWPVLVIPIVTVVTALGFRGLGLDANRGALVGLGFGGVVAMAVALAVTGRGDLMQARTMMREGRRLNEAMGAVNILPQLLASLGVIFTAAKVGDLIAAGVRQLVPGNQLFLLVLANCLGMALFTIVMGNSFAAFPVMASGVLVPLLIRPFGVDPALAAIITLTAGSSGTLMTPMAANFNIVPAALLNLRDQYGVIRFQFPFALALWFFHVVWLWWSIRSITP